MFIPHTCKDLFFHGLIPFALMMLYLDEQMLFHISPEKLCKFCTHKHDFQLKNTIYIVIAYIHAKQLEEHQIH